MTLVGYRTPHMQEQLEALKLTKHQYQKELRSLVQIDPTFKEFASEFRDYTILSSGTDINIKTVLEHHEVHYNRYQIISNYLTFEQENIKMHFPYDDRNAVDKKSYIIEMQKLGYSVIFIGDSYSDFEAGLQADYVFARTNQRLSRYLAGRREFTSFNNFDEVKSKLKNIF